MYSLSDQEALNTEIDPEVVSQKKIHAGTPQANQHRTSNCQVQGAVDDPHPCPVYIFRPGQAVIPGGVSSCWWLVPTSHHENRPGTGPVSRNHLRPTTSRKRAMRVHWSNEGTGTSTNCSASCGTRRTRRGGGHEDVDDLQHILQLVHHLRHRGVKSRQPKNDVTSLLHGAPQNPLLRIRHGCQPVWPGATELRHADDVEVIVPRAGLLRSGFFRNSAV